jgi:creatinine amidohydrolase/Fe(II)-dependent formamide hydrolase-like protein
MRRREFITACKFAVLIASALWTVAVIAQTPDTVFIEELTWPELRDAISIGKTTVILPVGGTEQNGPHMVIGKHNFIVKYTSEQIARRLGNTLVAPVVTYVPEGNLNPPTSHMRFPGTITLPHEHFIKLIEFAARSFKLHGFKDIIFIGDHGSYQDDMKIVADQLSQEWNGSGVRVHFVPQYYNDNNFAGWLETQGITKREIGSHASITDTSQLLALDPKYIRMEKLVEGVPENGISGDPRRANAEMGKRGLEFKIEAGVEQIRRALATSQTK